MIRSIRSKNQGLLQDDKQKIVDSLCVTKSEENKNSFTNVFLTKKDNDKVGKLE